MEEEEGRRKGSLLRPSTAAEAIGAGLIQPATAEVTWGSQGARGREGDRRERGVGAGSVGRTRVRHKVDLVQPGLTRDLSAKYINSIIQSQSQILKLK